MNRSMKDKKCENEKSVRTPARGRVTPGYTTISVWVQANIQ